MPILVACPKCAAKLNAPDSAAGKKVKCPKCQTPLVVPAAAAGEPDFEVVDEPQPEPAKPAAKAAKPKAKAVVEDDGEDEAGEKPRPKKAKVVVEEDGEDEERPRKKKKKPADEDEGKSMMVRNIIGGVLLLVLLGVAGWVFYDKLGKKDDTASNPNGTTPPPVTPGTPGIPGPGAGPPPPVGAGGIASNPKATTFMRLTGEWTQLIKSMTDSLNRASDKETALSAAKLVEESAARIQKIADEVKAIGEIKIEEAGGISIPKAPNDAPSLRAALAAASKQLGVRVGQGSISAEVIGPIQNALEALQRADRAYAESLRLVIPWGKKDKGP